MGLLIQETQRPGNICVLELKGTVDMGNVDDLAFKFKDVQKRNLSKVIVDMKEVESFSSAGWGCLVEAQYKFKQAGGELILSGMLETQLRVFELMGLEESFRQFLDIPTASHEFIGGK